MMSNNYVDNITACYANLKKTALGALHRDCHSDGEPINDQKIYYDLQDCLLLVNALGVVFCHYGNGNMQACMSMDYQKDEYLIKKKIIERGKIGENGVMVWNLDLNGDNILCVSVYINSNSVESFGSVFNDEIIIIDPSRNIFGDLSINKNSENSEKWFSIAATFREIFIQRNRAYHHFPVALSMIYWNNVYLLEKASFLPPWRKLSAVKTITLSLDLRKSTLAMEQARDHQKFATWMHDLLKKLTDTALNHFGVFDKFTGDGVIVHFLVDDLKGLPGQPTGIEVIERAVCCAAAMIREVDDMLPRLREILLNDCDQFGAGVGLSVDGARWRTDHTGSPIVVGRGVVTACRAADSAKAGVIRLINSAYQDYRTTILGMEVPARQQIFESKEFPKEKGMRVWDLYVPRICSASRFGAIRPSATPQNV